MTPILHILESVDELLRKRMFEKAIKVLGGIDLESISPAEKAYRNLLYVESSLYLGNNEVTDILEQVLDYYRDSTENKKFARAKFLNGWLLTSLGKCSEAEEELLESYVYYKRCGNLQGQARALNRLGYAKYILGDVKSAVIRLRSCLKLYDKIGDDENKSIVSMNLAQLLYATGDLTDSLILYDRSKAVIQRRGALNVCAFHNMSAIPHALKGDFKEARRVIERARPYLDNYPREKAIFHENLGWIYLLQGNYRIAEKNLLKGLKISMAVAPESALVPQIKRRLAEACLGLGQFARAKSFADEAMAAAEEINERVEIAACCRIYAQLENRNKSDEASRSWYKKAIDMFAIIGSRYELAVTRYLAAISGLYRDGERQALLYLAREYFESEAVIYFLDKIDSDIKSVQISSVDRDYGAAERHAPEFITINRGVKRLINLARHVAPSKMSVLLTGPTGTGKDLLARYIHHHSGRSGRFVSVNSVAIPDSMTEAELFGHRKGSFTGAAYDKEGLIEVARGGTLYLNEIAESTQEFQSKLLDVLENKIIRRLGETEEREVDFRLIAATNHDLEEMVRDGRFRADLYHRLKEIPITLPPLSDRLDDIPVLLEYFLIQAGISGKELRLSKGFDNLALLLSSFEWPGNIREFKAEVERLTLMGKGDLVRMAELAYQYHASEKDQLLILLNRTNWNRSQVAKILGIAEGTVRHRIKKYNLTPAEEVR